MPRYKSDSEDSESESAPAALGDDLYLISEVLDHKEDKHGNRSYFVSWENYDDSENSWQNEADMPSDRSLVKAYWKSKGGDPATKNGKNRIVTSQYASVDSQACAEPKKTDLDNVDASALAKIRKALKLASHEGTGEAEAKAAIRLAHKLMQGLNINQADVMAQENKESKAKRAGISVVGIYWRDPIPKKQAPKARDWMDELAWAMEGFFTVEWYSETFPRGKHLSYHFYGLAENSVAAAAAFEMCANQIMYWCEAKKQSKELKGTVAPNSYMYGVAQGLLKMAEETARAEEAAARAEEKRQRAAQIAEENAARQRQLDRLAGLSHHVEEIDQAEELQPISREPSPLPEDVFESDHGSPSLEEDNRLSEPLGGGTSDGDNTDDDAVDFNDEIEEPAFDLDKEMDKADAKVKQEDGVRVKQEAESPRRLHRDSHRGFKTRSRAAQGAALQPKKEEDDVKPIIAKVEVADKRASAETEVELPGNAKFIAEEYYKKKLKKLGVKASSKSYKRKHDEKAYATGVKDARQIDVKRARIEGAGAS